MKKGLKKTLTIFFLLFLSICSTISLAQDEKAEVYFFYGKGCPHCAHEKPILKDLETKYPIKVNYLELSKKENANFFLEMAKAFEISAGGVPTTFIDDKVWIGYSDQVGKEIELKIKECIEKGCINAKEKLETPSKPEELREIRGATPVKTIFGTIDTGMSKKFSLPVLTIILAALDSFNPCAFFVLLFLLSMLVYAKSKARMLLIGGTFIFFSGLIYFIFMNAFNIILELFTKYISCIRIIAGVIALFIATINIKDFFWFKKGITLSISEKAKPTLFQRMRGLLKATSLISLLIGTVVLAVTANLYELLCTAGLPMVYITILKLNNLSSMSQIMYILFYNIIYIIPLFVIVVLFTFTLGAKRLSEKTGRRLKLISGMMMLLLGLILLINPALMNNVMVSIGVLATALISSCIIMIITKNVKRFQKAVEEAEKCKVELEKKKKEEEKE